MLDLQQGGGTTAPNLRRLSHLIVRALAIAAVGTASVATSSGASELPEAEVDGWRSDLRFIMTELPLVHPDPYTRVSRETLEGELLELEARLTELERHEIMVEIGRIVALVGDGHTRLTLPLAPGIEFFQGHSRTPPPALEGLVIRQFPIRFGLFPEGLVVTAVDRNRIDAEKLLGSLVVRLGTLSSEQAMEAVAETIERDNEWQVRHHLPERLVLAEVLHGCGVIESPESLPLVVESTAGVYRTELSAIAPEATVDWALAGSGSPPSLAPREEIFSLSEIESGLLYVRLDEIGDRPDETLAAFASRVEHELERPDARRLVIDLRHNRGGDGSLNVPLLHSLIRADRLRAPASLFVLVGRTTFSAAMMLAVDLERHTRAVFVGEPTGSSPNHFGDSRKSRLPYSGLTVRISTREWQYSHPLEERAAIEPLVDAPLTAETNLAGRDPALEAILAFAAMPAGAPEGRWEGRLAYERSVYELIIEVTDDGGTLDLPAAEIEGLPLIDLHSESPRLSFAVALGQQNVDIEVEVRGDQMIGFLDDRRRGGTLVLHRVPPE